MESVLDLLRAGIDSTMLATGKADASEFGQSDLVVALNFPCALGISQL